MHLITQYNAIIYVLPTICYPIGFLSYGSYDYCSHKFSIHFHPQHYLLGWRTLLGGLYSIKIVSPPMRYDTCVFYHYKLSRSWHFSVLRICPLFITYFYATDPIFIRGSALSFLRDKQNTSDE